MKKYFSDNNFYGGKYYKRLFAVFTVTAVLVAALFSFFLLGIVLRIYENEKAAYKTLAQSRYNLADTAVAVVIGGMESFVKNPYFAEWADAEDANQYYKKAISLYNYIQSISSGLGPLAYEVAVVGERYGTMTLSALGSGPFKWYTQNETSLSDTDIKDICMRLQDSNETAVIPVYGADGQLRELYFMRKQQWKTQTTFVIFKVFAAPLLLPLKNENFYIYGPRNIAICANPAKKNENEHENTAKYVRYTFPLHTPSWSLQVEFRKHTDIRIGLFAVIVVFSLFIFTACIRAAKRIARRLYAPLGEIIYGFAPSRPMCAVHDGGETKRKTPLDEFEILRNNSGKLELLSQELQKVIKENEALTLQQYNRGLLEGLVPERERENTDTFFVASVLLTNEMGVYEIDRRPYIQLFAEACAIENGAFQYIQYGIEEFALILRCENADRAKKSLNDFLAKLQDSCDSASIKIQAALSDAVSGKAALQDAFKQARFISEFRHTQPYASILTTDTVTFAASASYDYPLETEKKLLALIIGGGSGVSDCFDEVIQKNLRNASVPFAARQNLLYALCGTLIRALQELKSTPEELYGKAVDWAALYAGYPDEKIFYRLKNIAEDIAAAVRKNTSDTDTKILHLMHNYICNNFQRDISLQDLSDEFNITPKYCSKLFARLNNNTFKNYLNAFRIERAQQMIADNPHIKITDLAGLVGFNSATSFIRVFNKYTGVSPKVYAEQMLGKEG